MAARVCNQGDVGEELAGCRQEKRRRLSRGHGKANARGSEAVVDLDEGLGYYK
jgi:hypothetical protein